MKMTLNTLNIEHFKGIKRFGIAPNGVNLSITGRNKQGKTTIYDAFLWLLFGKNSAGETKFTVKPTNEPAETENYVEAQFDVDGKPLLLKKVYASKYVKTTGEYKGSELEYYINGVPKKKNEYEAAIAEIIDEEQFKLLTNPKHFTEVLDWKKRREILFSLAETKSDSELAAENLDFAEIRTELETMGNASELLKAVSAQVKNNSERINVLPKLINGVPWTLNTGESPKDVNVSFLSQILETNAPRKYYLSARACKGILRRAEKRVKELPPLLKAVLEYQASRQDLKVEQEQKQEI